MRHFVVACVALGSCLAMVAAGLAAEKQAAGAAARTTPLPTAEAVGRFKLPDDLAVEVVLAEPAISQPVFMNFDERGRMWVVEYLQYPFPAGLKILSEDKFLRATYDKVPPPPPDHFPGLDRITIHEDSDGDGTFESHKTFLEGLNIATAVERGRGGVWVLNPPYLLFYPDRDRDDVPDSDPQVHLSGFGMEDTHSVVNSLVWGPDGWLYAAQGSTVSGEVLRPGTDDKPVHSLGQLIWRYHPGQRRYEIFAEGGGNAFGVEIDSLGRIYSGHNGGDTRGFHYVQGGYFQKGFTKHGPLSNPYAFGYFPAMKHHTVPRFTHTFVIYEGGRLPQPYAGRLFGVAPLLNHVVYSSIEPDGSSFKTTDLGHLLTTDDAWFRPVDIKVGPDGGVYVADMYEPQIAHLRHHEGTIDKSTGRIYRVRAEDAGTAAHQPAPPFDLAELSTADLVGLLSHPNKWQRRTALRLLGDRRDGSVLKLLGEQLDSAQGQLALETLWALNLCGGLDEALITKALDHANPYVRSWAVRLAGDDNQVSPAVAQRLAALAASEPHLEVRSQLACTARRLSTQQGLPIVRQLLARDEDAGDIHIPLLLWWAIEAKADSDRQEVLKLFEDSAIWDLAIVRRHILHRLMRRFAQAGGRGNLLTCAHLLRLSPSQEQSRELVRGFEEAFQGRPLSGLPDELSAALAGLDGQSIALGIRQGKAEAIDQALAIIADEKAQPLERLEYIQVFGQVHQPRCAEVLLDVVRTASDDGLRMAALAALQPYAEAPVSPAVLELYRGFTDEVRVAAHMLLASRRDWSLDLLRAVDAGAIESGSIPPATVRKLTVHNDEEIGRLVARHFGDVEGATTAEMQAQIARLLAAAGGGSGSPYEGKKIFTATCGKCHRLFEQGGQIGPDLTSYKRDDPANILTHIVNPSVEVREGFESFQVQTMDGRVVTGFLIDRDNQVVVLRGVDGQNVTLAQDQIDVMEPDRKSLMPEGLLSELSDQQVRDLLAYLRSGQPLND